MSPVTVYKYTLGIDDDQTVEMPRGADLLTVMVQGGDVCLWARVDPRALPSRRRISVRGTGHPDATGAYVGSVMLLGGSLVFHVFDHGETP